VLDRVRAALEGPIVLFKGPEVAARYPDPVLRPFGDLDLLVPDPTAAQARLLQTGFTIVGSRRAGHHLAPVALPNSPLWVELHRSVPWPRALHPPPTEDLIASAIPAAVGCDGILAPPSHVHALLLAAHSWHHTPLRRLLDLVDVAVLAEEGDRSEMASLVETWGLSRVWNTTNQALDALFDTESGASWPLGLYGARHLPAVRERTVAECHFARWQGALTATTRSAALHALTTTFLRDVRPAPDEAWLARMSRGCRGVMALPRPASSRWRES